MLIGGIVSDCRVMAPSALAATLGSEQISFAELDELSDSLVDVFGRIGIGRGDRLAWLTETSLIALAGFVACARLGAIFVPLSPQEQAERLSQQLTIASPKLVIIKDGINLQTPTGDRSEIATMQVSELKHRVRNTVPATLRSRQQVHPDDPHIMYLTSGSTGFPKGVLVSHRATYLRSCPGTGTFGGGITGYGGLLSTFPLSHYGGWHYVVEAWLCRTAIHLVSSAKAEPIVETLERRKPSALYAIPGVWERILENSNSTWDFLRHADTGTSRFDLELLDRIANAAPNATTTVLYGASETGPICRRSFWQVSGRNPKIDPHSVGRAVAPGVIRLSNDGEILFKGPTTMIGYFGDSKRTDESFTKATAEYPDRWYRTGDIGEIDDQGNLTITGRANELIRTGGETVSPAEIEAILRRHPAIDDAAVVGIPDPTWGEIVCAVLVAKHSIGECIEDQIKALFQGAPAAFTPRRIVLCDRIPRTEATGQVRRRYARSLLESGKLS